MKTLISRIEMKWHSAEIGLGWINFASKMKCPSKEIKLNGQDEECYLLRRLADETYLRRNCGKLEGVMGIVNYEA